jgi:hypothetical protein
MLRLWARRAMALMVVNAAEREQLALIVADRNQPRKYVVAERQQRQRSGLTARE